MHPEVFIVDPFVPPEVREQMLEAIVEDGARDPSVRALALDIQRRALASGARADAEILQAVMDAVHDLVDYRQDPASARGEILEEFSSVRWTLANGLGTNTSRITGQRRGADDCEGFATVFASLARALEFEAHAVWRSQPGALQNHVLASACVPEVAVQCPGSGLSVAWTRAAGCAIGRTCRWQPAETTIPGARLGEGTSAALARVGDAHAQRVFGPSAATGTAPAGALASASDLANLVGRHILLTADETGALFYSAGAPSPAAKRVPKPVPKPVGPRLALPAPLLVMRPDTRRVPVYTRPAFRTVDELLRTCPSPDEIAAIRTDFNITFARAVMLESWSCTEGGAESSVMLIVYNLFRAMRLIEFDAPMPVLGATNLYEWLFAQHYSRIEFTRGEEFSSASGGEIWIRSELMAAPWERAWVDAASGVGLAHLVGLMVHEGRHAMPGGPAHNCDTRDSSLEFAGAWAAQYWFFRWLAEHSGGYLTSRQKSYAQDDAEATLSRFCLGR